MILGHFGVETKLHQEHPFGSSSVVLEHDGAVSGASFPPIVHFSPDQSREVSEKLKSRFESYAEGEGAEMRLKRENLRSVLEPWEEVAQAPS